MNHLKCNENPYYKILFNDDLKLLADYDDDRKMKFRIASNQPGGIDSIALTNKVLWKKHQGQKVVCENNKKQFLSDLTYEEKLQMIHKAFFHVVNILNVLMFWTIHLVNWFISIL